MQRHRLLSFVAPLVSCVLLAGSVPGSARAQQVGTSGYSPSGRGGYLLPSGPLSASGSQIIDAAGTPARIDSIGWDGSSDPPGSALHGLWAASYQTILDSVKADGFNAIRIGWADANLNRIPANTQQLGTINFTKNPDIRGLTTIQIYEKIVAYAGQVGLKIIFDHHSNEGTRGQQPNGLWFDSGPGSNGTDGAGVTGTVTAAKFKANWLQVAQAFAGNDTVIGYDLDNEPLGGSGKSNWGGGGTNDIRAMYQDVGNAILAIDSHKLIFAEGLIGGSGLGGAKNSPVVLTVPKKLIYSVHKYPGEISGNTNDSGSAYIQSMNNEFGWLISQNIAPVWIGEMGSSMTSSDSKGWASTIIAYLNGQDGAQGGPTFSGNQQPVSTSWWRVGNDSDNPDGIQSAWGLGNYRPEQQAVTDQFLFIPKSGSAPPPSPSPQPPPPPPSPTASSDNTVITTVGPAITDASGNKWSITSGGQVAVNGAPDVTTGRVVELAYEKAIVWQENADKLWWDKSKPSDTWAPPSGTSISPVPVAPATSDSLILTLSEDRYQADAQFVVKMDGQQLGSAQSVTALHSAGATQQFSFSGNWGTGTHDLEIDFINDLYGGKGLDRNLYVNQVNYDGKNFITQTEPLYSNGAIHVTVSRP